MVFNPQEWELRCDLAAAYRLFARFGMDDLIFTHLSVRLPVVMHSHTTAGMAVAAQEQGVLP